MKTLGNLAASLVLLGGMATQADTQTRLHLHGQDHLCSFAPDEVFEEQIYSFSSSKQAEDMVAQTS